MRFTQQGGDDSGYLSAFNFSSLTDIVMLLLIFFLLTSSFVTTKGLNVVLPDASNTENPPEERVYVSVDGERNISFDDEDVTKEELPGLVAEQIRKDTASIIVLKADENLPYTVVIEMLDIVKGAGATRFFLATDKPKR